MAWRPGELWFDADVLWFRERPSSGLTDDGVVGPETLSALSAAVNGT